MTLFMCSCSYKYTQGITAFRAPHPHARARCAAPSPRCVVRPLLRWQKERQERESQREHAEVVRESRAQVGDWEARRRSRAGVRRGDACER